MKWQSYVILKLHVSNIKIQFWKNFKLLTFEAKHCNQQIKHINFSIERRYFAGSTIVAAVGNRNKKIASPAKQNRSSKSKCTKVKLINHQIMKNKSQLRNNTQASLSNHIPPMIDDCGNGESNEEDENVDFVQEWINTYTFLSREFILSFNFLLFFDFINTCKIASCPIRANYFALWINSD